MAQKNSIARSSGRSTPTHATPPQSPRRLGEGSQDPQGLPVDELLDTRPPAAPPPAVRALEAAQEKLLVEIADAPPTTETSSAGASNADGKACLSKKTVALLAWMVVGGVVVMPITTIAAYAEPGSIDSAGIENHPGWVFPTGFVGGALAGGLLRFLHDRFFG